MKNKSNVLKWGLIGCGDVAERKGGPALYTADDSELVAVMSRNLAKAESFAQRHGAKFYYDSLDPLLANPQINAVYIATPVALHCEQTILAAKAGKHVLCEKPMAMNVAECKQMMQACERADVSLGIAYYRRTFPNIVKMKSLGEAGAIGKILLAKVENHSPFRTPAGERRWKIDPKLSGGGVMMDIGSHRLDLLQFLLGDFQHFSGRLQANLPGVAVDSAATFYGESLSGASVIGSVRWDIPLFADSVTLYGSEGRFIANPINSGKLVLENAKGIKNFQFAMPAYTHLGLVRNFVARVRNGVPLVCDGIAGIATNRLLEKFEVGFGN